MSINEGENMRVKSTFSVAKWDEKPVADWPDKSQPVNQLFAIYRCDGDIAGDFVVAGTMFYSVYDTVDAHNSVADYRSFMKFDGSINGQTGSFVLSDSGHYENFLPNSKLEIVAGSGTGDFSGAAGGGKYYAEGSEMIIELELTKGEK